MVMTGFENMTTDQVAQLAALCVQELAARSAQPVPPAMSPLQALLASVGAPQQPAVNPAQAAANAAIQGRGQPLVRPGFPPPTRPMISNTQGGMPLPNVTATGPLPPGTVIANANTDPFAAAVFAQTAPRVGNDGMINGNGVGHGGVAEPVG